MKLALVLRFSELTISETYASVFSSHCLLPFVFPTGHYRVSPSDRKRPLSVRGCRRSADPASEVVPVFRLRHRHPLPRVQLGVRSGPAGR